MGRQMLRPHLHLGDGNIRVQTDGKGFCTLSSLQYFTLSFRSLIPSSEQTSFKQMHITNHVPVISRMQLTKQRLQM